MLLQDLAEADSQRELVVSVAEAYADVVALSPSHFSVPLGAARNAALLNPACAGALDATGALPPCLLPPPPPGPAPFSGGAPPSAAPGHPFGGGGGGALGAMAAAMAGGGGAAAAAARGGSGGGGGFSSAAANAANAAAAANARAQSSPLLAPLSPAAAEAQFDTLDRLVQGLSAVCLAVRRRPVVRRQRGSEPAARVAEALHALAYRQRPGVFDFGSRAAPVLLVLDRRDDPVTPLLTQWTYEAMAHETLGTTDGTARLWPPPPGLEGGALGAAAAPEPEGRSVVLDRDADAFFGRHALSNYGEVGAAVRGAVQSFAARTAAHRGGAAGGGGGAGAGAGAGGGGGGGNQRGGGGGGGGGGSVTLEEMKKFVLEHGDFQRAQAGVSKHVNVMSCLSAAISGRGLMDVSPLEQELATPGGGLGGGGLGGGGGFDAPPGLGLVGGGGGAAAAAYEAVLRVVRALPPLSVAPGPAGGGYDAGGGGGGDAAAANAAAALRLARQAPTDAAAAASCVGSGQPGGRPGRPFPADKDAARLVALFALRHGEADPPRLAALVDALAAAGVRARSPVAFAAVASALLPLCGAARRSGDLFGPRAGHAGAGAGGLLAKGLRAIAKGLAGEGMMGGDAVAENVYTQHTPLLLGTLRQLAAGALPAGAYPYVGGGGGGGDGGGGEEAAAWAAAYRQRPPVEVIVFIVGGTTYEEARVVEEWNARQQHQHQHQQQQQQQRQQQHPHGGGGGAGGGAGGGGGGGGGLDALEPPHPPMRVILGGSGVINSDMFLAALGGGAVGGAAGSAGGLGAAADGQAAAAEAEAAGGRQY